MRKHVSFTWDGSLNSTVTSNRYIYYSTRKQTYKMKETTAKELKARLDSGNDFTLLDVREPHEYYMADLEGTTRIPFDELNSRMEELDKNQEIIVMCRSGSSAGDAVKLLTENGFDKSSRLKGGINEWAEKIDPSIPQY